MVDRRTSRRPIKGPRKYGPREKGPRKWSTGKRTIEKRFARSDKSEMSTTVGNKSTENCGADARIAGF